MVVLHQGLLAKMSVCYAEERADLPLKSVVPPPPKLRMNMPTITLDGW